MQPDVMMQMLKSLKLHGTVNFKLDVASTIKFRRLFAPVGGRV
ncbi:hypothetical protein HDG38_006724 [Paraburkholderia sp. WSM4177]|nr:hypothetical protein [Paraburkholderia sp. WSM4177]MBB5488492.1 hypothetical protein [Paraburkholderia sp. WSM4180]